MERAKKLLKYLKEVVSESVMEDVNLDVMDRMTMYNHIKNIEADIEESEKKTDIIDIPKLPRGDEYNGYPRITYAMACEYYSRDRFFTISEMVEATGSSRNQVKLDLERLEADGFIKHIDGYTGERKTRYYKYKPTNL